MNTIILILLLNFVNSCDSSGSGLDVSGTLDPPTEFMATSIDSTTIGLKWTNSETFVQNRLKNYEITVYEPGDDDTLKQTFTTKKYKEPFTLNGFETSNIYIFELKVVYTDGSTSEPVLLQWAPAKRFDEYQAPVFRLYEPGSWEGCGVEFYDSSRYGPERLSYSYIDKWSVGLYTVRSNSRILFGSPNKLPAYNYPDKGGSYMVSNKIEYANGLSDYYMNTDMSEEAAGIEYDYRVYDLDTIDPGEYEGIVLNLAYDHGTTKNPDEMQYAKVFIDYNKTGDSFLSEYQNERFIIIQISYQPNIGFPYAKTYKK